MKVTVSIHGMHETYEGEDLTPLVNDRELPGQLDIIDSDGRTQGIYPAGQWDSARVEHDEGDDDDQGDEAGDDQPTDSVGTAYIDIKPRAAFTEDDLTNLLQAVSGRHDGIDISITTR